MSDSKRLLEELQQYYDSLEKRSNLLRIDFEQLKARWISFVSVSEGDYVNQFQSGWDRTCSNFISCINQSEKDLIWLRIRIEDLSKFNSVGGDDNYLASSNSPSSSQSSFSQEDNHDEDNNDVHIWDLLNTDIQSFINFYKEKDEKKKTNLSRELGEIYGDKMAVEIFGYSTDLPGYGRLLDPIEKYKSFPQGFDAVYFDPFLDEIVVVEFKGQTSSLSDEQKKLSYVSSVYQKIINSDAFPYRNAPASERDLAFEIKRMHGENRVRFEVYRTCWDMKNEQLFTRLEKRILPEATEVILDSSRKLLPQSGERDNEGIENTPEVHKRIKDLIALTQDLSRPVAKREEAYGLLSSELLNIASQIYESDDLSASQKKRLKRALKAYRKSLRFKEA
jgi:hypothetical protein